MKIALYIEDGLEQIVLTPETDTEKAITKKLAAASDEGRELSVYGGGFYQCRGGWARHNLYADQDTSAIIVLRRPKPDSP